MNWLHPFRSLWREAAIAYLSWAEREIRPDHPDAHFIHRRLLELRAERSRS